jgi:hypothetical protein
MSDPQRKTVWTCQVSPDRTVRLEDIPARQLAELEASLDTNWLVLVGAPLGKSAVTLAMYERCCALAGVPPQELTAGELIKVFELVDDDRPDQFTEGEIPKAEGPTTAG